MKKFVVIYHAPASAAMEQMGKMANASPEEQQKAMAPWMEWFERAGSAVVDPGSPLWGGQKLSKAGSSPSDKDVTAYSILQAEDMEAAKALLQGHPQLEWIDGAEIEIHEAMSPPA